MLGTTIPLSVEQIALARELVTSAEQLIAGAEATVEAGYNGKFYLINQGGQMVVYKDEGENFKLGAARAGSGYEFESYKRASSARYRWNSALNDVQRRAGCEVHVASHALYLEYIIQNATEVRDLMVSSLAKINQLD